MKKYIYSTVMMLAMIMSVVCVTSCGGSDDEPETPVNPSIGKHKVEISLSGDVNSFVVSYSFVGFTADGNVCPIYDADGNDRGLSYTNSVDDSQWSSVMAYTSSNASYLKVGLAVGSEEAGKTITVTFKGYVNDKLVQTTSKTVTSSSEYDHWALGFSSNDGLEEFTEYLYKD